MSIDASPYVLNKHNLHMEGLFQECTLGVDVLTAHKVIACNPYWNYNLGIYWQIIKTLLFIGKRTWFILYFSTYQRILASMETLLGSIYGFAKKVEV